MLAATKAALEHGLRVRDITTYELEVCAPSDDLSSVLTDECLKAFDCIPVRDGAAIIGYVWRADGDHGLVRERMRQITESMLVSADMPLTTFLPLFAGASHRLVLDGTAIRGIVTWSDLQKLPVRLLAFSLVTHLEMAMALAIHELFQRDEEWLAILKTPRQQGITDKLKERQRSGLEPPLLELTDFCDKRTILKKRLQLGGQFEADLKRIEEVRNVTAHAGSYAETPDAVRQFVLDLQRAEYWIAELSRTDVARKA
jgi:hypothetical protein